MRVSPVCLGVSVVVGSQTVVTDASGVYTASGVPAGSVSVDIVEASLPTGSVQTAGVDPSTMIVTGGGTVDAGSDGFQQRGSVTGVVFNDVNGNGAQDVGELGLSGCECRGRFSDGHNERGWCVHGVGCARWFGVGGCCRGVAADWFGADRGDGPDDGDRVGRRHS